MGAKTKFFDVADHDIELGLGGAWFHHNNHEMPPWRARGLRPTVSDWFLWGRPPLVGPLAAGRRLVESSYKIGAENAGAARVHMADLILRLVRVDVQQNPDAHRQTAGHGHLV